MKLKKIILLPIILILLFTCSKDDENEEQLCNDLPYDRCCMRGANIVSPNETSNYVYTFKRPDASIEWEIIDGDVTILDVETTNSGGETKSIATIQFNTDFTMTRFTATADHIINEERCTYYFNVYKPD